MTNKERTFLLGGVGIGVATAALAMGALTFQGEHKHAASVPSSAAMQTTPQSAANDGTQPGATVELTPEEISAAGVQVVEVGKARLKTELEAFGRVEQPVAQLAVISARVGGRIDKLYVDYTGQPVRRGQPVAEIYSPEVASSIEEYRLAIENRERMRKSSLSFVREQSDEMVNAARRRLELWGVTAKQIDASGPVPATITTYATVGGSVMERKVALGQYVNAGDTLFTVADLSQVWVKADVYESQLPSVRPGQQVEIESDALPGQMIHGSVELIEPTANAETRTVPVHVHVANPGMRLRPGMFVRAKFTIRNGGDTVVVPRSAVLDTGTRKLVFLAKEGGTFEAREIEIGAGTDEFFPVLRGLSAGDKVVTNGNFLIDSQTRLSGSMSSLFGGSKEFKNGEEPQKSAAPNASQPPPSNETAKLTFMIDPNPPKGAADAMFHITLNDANGKPIPDAKVTVTFVMPAMPAMGMPEMRVSYDVPWSGGMYMGKGKVPMAGSWNVTVEATRNGQRIATYRTRVTAK